MKTNTILKELLILVILLVPVIGLVLAWGSLPAEIPIHWDIHGEINGYGPKYLPAIISAGVYVLLLVIPFLDPRKKNFSLFSTSYYKIRLILTLFLSLFSGISMLYVADTDINMTKLVMTTQFLMIALFGNYLSTVRPNYFVGIRTPWTLENDVVWKKTHHLASKIWFWCGLAGMAISLAVNPEYLPFWITIPLLATIILVPVIYSWWIFQKEPTGKNGSPEIKPEA